MEYLVSGCGVSMICNSKESVMGWITEIVMKGGTPVVNIIALPDKETA